jgi:preprotein translocase subunit SecF
MTETRSADGIKIEESRARRLMEGQTSIDFIGRRRHGAILSLSIIAVTLLSLFTQGLNLGIDFEGGVSWDVPASNFTVDDADRVLGDNGLSTEGARIQRRGAESGDFIKVQVGNQPEEVGEQLRAEFAAAANVSIDEINVNLVSSSWGSDITDKAVRALVFFFIAVALFIAIRFEWRMAVGAIIATAHDVVISIGVYSILQFVVTPATVIAFLTILGYSLYDTIVVFDRVRENEARFAALKPPYDDVINVSMNQVLMRSLTTSFSSIVPVVSLLLIGSGIMGATTLSEFALALLIGMITGAYSSIMVAAPLLGILKQTDKNWTSRNIPRAVGPALREMVMGGNIGSRRSREMAADGPTAGSGKGQKEQPPTKQTASQASAVLAHPPRPRKKKRR